MPIPDEAWDPGGPYDYSVRAIRSAAPHIDRAARIDELEAFAAKLASTGTTVGDAYQWAMERLVALRLEPRD